MSPRRPPHRHQSPDARPGAAAGGHDEEYPALLSASLDGELAPEDQGALDAHLDTCPRCVARKAALLAQADALRQASERVLQAVDLNTFSSGVMRAIARDRARPGVLVSARQAVFARVSELWSGRRVQLLASAGALACACLLLLVSAGQRRSLPGAPVPGPLDHSAARASVESLDVSGASYAVLDLEGAPTTVIWVSEEGN